MNIFFLSECPVKAAKMQCSKHIVKMALESAQMLSSTHRILDGVKTSRLSKSGNSTVKHWTHPTWDHVLYKASHVGHPCTQWTMATKKNYEWHFLHWKAISNEYSHRYGKIHASWSKLKDVLSLAPENIADGKMTSPALAMPEEFKMECPVESYRNYYFSKSENFKMEWHNSETPKWFKERMESHG